MYNAQTSNPLFAREVQNLILSRRSVRVYTEEPISDDTITDLIKAASFAPSGKNRQPWKFFLLTDKASIHSLTLLAGHSKFMATAPCMIFVYLDQSLSYNPIKDVMAVGASIQNLLLYAHAKGLGACWIGELNEYANEVAELLHTAPYLSLLASITLGIPKQKKIPIPRRKPVSEIFTRL